jgi:hypothetical protein
MQSSNDIGGMAAIRDALETTSDWPAEKTMTVSMCIPVESGITVPTICVSTGDRHIAANDGVNALHHAGTRFYQRNGRLVRVCLIKTKNSAGDVIFVPGIDDVTAALLDRELGKAARWERFDGRSKKTVRIDPPAAVARQILEMVEEWPFPSLSGIIGCPTLRRDGSLLTAEGYDLATGLVLYMEHGIRLPTIAESPTRDDAMRAAQLLNGLLGEFPFVDDQVSRAVALSALITPVLRGSMTAVPMHLITAPQPGSGKSYLIDLASAIATGESAAVIAAGHSPEEMEKRLVGAALACHPIIALDNCRSELSGDFLCQVTERPLLQLRALGKSDKIRIPNSFTTFANGNNVAVADDMVRRTVWCRLDANMENPETRTFEARPLACVLHNRGRYVAAALTIALAYIAAGKPACLPPLASYEDWSEKVRSALVWLGFADPVDSMEAARVSDPVRQDRTAVFEAWRAELGTSNSYLAAEIAQLAEDRHNYDGSPRRPALYAALLANCAKHGNGAQIDPRRLGRWLTNHENTIASGCKLVVDRSDKSRVRYGLRWQ